jgi:hypothetical protein
MASMKISRQARIWTATIVWLAVAALLAWRGTVRSAEGAPDGYFAAIATTQGKLLALGLALLIGGAKGWFVLSKSAARTARFIMRRPERDWVWNSFHPVLYVLIPLMILFGWGLRHFWGAQHPALVVGVYVGIAVALLVGVRGFHQTLAAGAQSAA